MLFFSSARNFGCIIFAGLIMLSLTSLQLSAQSDDKKADDVFGLKPGDDLGKSKASPKFVNLLDSKDLSHFRGYKSNKIGDGWKINGKQLVFDGSGGGDIMTNESYEDFELQIEWSVEEGGNSGIMFHVTTGHNQPYDSGPEIQILDDDKHADGKSDLTSAGSLYGLYPAKDKTLRNVGSFNKSRIIVKGNMITHYLNNKKVLEAEIGSDDWNQRLEDSKFKDWEHFAKSDSGHIVLQDHGDPVKFRNIRIKRLVDAPVKSKSSGVDSSAFSKRSFNRSSKSLSVDSKKKSKKREKQNDNSDLFKSTKASSEFKKKTKK